MDTGVIAEGQAGKDADPSKFVTIVSFNELRQKVQDNTAALDALQNSPATSDLQDQVKKLSLQVANLTTKIEALEQAKSDTPKSDEPAKSDTPASSSTTMPDSTPASADPATSASSANTSDTSASSAAQ